MRFAILPLVIHRESQFVPAGNDVLIQGAPLGGALRAKSGFPTRSTKNCSLPCFLDWDCVSSLSPQTHPYYEELARNWLFHGFTAFLRMDISSIPWLDLHHGCPGGISRDPF